MDSPDRPAAAPSRAERSAAALAERFPHLAPALTGDNQAQPVRQDGVIVDLDLVNGARLYATDARVLAARQVDAYLEKPLRFFVTSVRGANTGSPVSARLLDFMFAECARLGIDLADLEVRPHYEGSYLVVFGIGLGYHLEPLIERTRARHLVVIEPYPEFLRHSLETIDWAGLLERADERGCKLTVSLTRRPDQMVSDIKQMFQDEGVPFIDGTYVFMHYPAWEMREARDRLAEAVETLFVSRGYFEDELVMITNTLANLAGASFRLIDNKLRPLRNEPVFIIGSGPSIDHSIERVKALRDKALVFSCGTGLKICLAHGIVPDFHCEIENGEWIYDALSLVMGTYGRPAGTTLVATLTVDPRVPGLFDDCILFFRDTVSGSQILAPAGAELFGAVPTVANTAVRTAMAMGLQNFYLFGIDCGAKSLDKKHSELAIYNDSEQFKCYEDAMDMAYTMPGNFGGLVKADWIFNFSRMMLEALIRTYRIKMTNCSDGVRIAGAQPRLPATVSLPGPALDRPQIKARLRAVLAECRPGQLLAELSFDRLRGEHERFRTDVLALIDAAIAEDRDFVAFWRRLAPFLEAAGADYARMPTVIRASLQSMPKIGMFFTHRIRDAGARQSVFDAFLQEYRAIALFMCDRFGVCLDELEQRHAAAGVTPPLR